MSDEGRFNGPTPVERRREQIDAARRQVEEVERRAKTDSVADFPMPPPDSFPGYQDLREIIDARLEELFRLILFQISQSESTKNIPSGLVITGGVGNMSGIAELGSKVTRLPVRVGIPHNPDRFDDVPADPAYATSLGLIYWKIKAQNTSGNTEPGGLHALLPRGLAYISNRI